MSRIVLPAGALQIGLPVVLQLWLWRRRPAGRGEWLIGVFAACAAIAALSIALPWLVVPWPMRYVYAAAAIAATARSWTRIAPETTARAGLRPRIWQIALVAFGAVMAVAAGTALTGRRVPASPMIDLACPLSGGTYLVVSGGSHSLVNAHLVTLAPDARFVRWRGQSYGVDLVRVDRLGRRASRLASPNPADYFIHGDLVTAPCAGTIVSTANNRPDMPVPERDPDRSRLAGNHVMIACGDVEVLLAHLRPRSVRVRAGTTVEVGDVVGIAGNSGNTDEPHLHVSAQRRAPGQPLLGGDPVWITVDGRFLVRNDRLSCLVR